MNKKKPSGGGANTFVGGMCRAINNVKNLNTMEDYEVDYDVHCPKCEHSPLHHRSCTNWCEDGYLEEFADDIEIEGMGYEVTCGGG